ncbi:MAG TPA: Flp pilus assembly protein CpaB [Micavibrio sp.]
MNKNVLIAFGGAVMIALVVAMIMSAMLKGGKKKEIVAETKPAVQILVATTAIDAGALLTEKNVKWKTWPQDGAFPGTIQRKGKESALEAAEGRLIRPVAMDEPILKSAFISDEGGFLAAMLKPGQRAVAVKTSARSMVGGFINPGDYVDVVLTYSTQIDVNSDDPALEMELKNTVEKNLNRYATETIMRNVRVLGIDQKAIKEEETGAKVGKTVTLEVNERGAEILALADQIGDISLSLRGLGDTDVSDTGQPTVSDARLIKINKEVFDELHRVAEASGAKRHNVRIYNGGVVTNLPTR